MKGGVHARTRLPRSRRKAWEEVPTPVVIRDTDAIVQLDPARFVTHHFMMDDFVSAYDTFDRAADTGALKVVVTP